jgi:hypothetical protein
MCAPRLDAHALLAGGISPELLNAPQARVSSAHYGCCGT